MAWGGQANGAAQIPAAAGRKFLHFIQYAQRDPRALGDGAAFVGDAQVAGVALEQRGAQRLLQSGDLLADGLGCQVQVARGRGEALVFYHAHEHREIIQVGQSHLDKTGESVCQFRPFPA